MVKVNGCRKKHIRKEVLVIDKDSEGVRKKDGREGRPGKGGRKEGDVARGRTRATKGTYVLRH